MVNPRWYKVLRDLWRQKTRTLLVVLSIAVGVAVVGTLVRTHVIVSREMNASYLLANPASAVIVADPFDDALVQTVGGMREVGAAEGRRSLTLRFRAGPDAWRNLRLIAVPDYSNIQVNKIWPEQGAWPPPKNELLIERTALAFMQRGMGDVVQIETPEGKQRELRVAGVVYDPHQPPSLMAGTAYGYISFDTLEWLGEPRDFNELHLVVANDALNRDHIRQVTDQVVRKIERSGRTVHSTLIPVPGKHWFDEFFQPIGFILQTIGFLGLILSGFLVVNTMTALLTQQIRQIGVMKAIGARTNQVVGIYFVMVLIFGLLALAFAMPLAALGAQVGVGSLASFANLDIADTTTPPLVLALEVVLALLVPLLAALRPILAATGISVREAISSYGIAESKKSQAESGRQRLLPAALGLLPALSRPLLLSLRNTFRQRGRLALTLTTLALGGAIFMAVFTVRNSLQLTFNSLFTYWQYDVAVSFQNPYRIMEIESQALRTPGVAAVETWGVTGVRRLRADDTESKSIRLFAPPTPTRVIQPTIVEGRWLLPNDEHALVVNTDLLKDEADIKAGDSIVLKIEGEETTWQVVGVIKGLLTGPMAYANYPYFERVTRNVGEGSILQVITEDHSGPFQAEVARALETSFKAAGLHVGSIVTTVDEQVRTEIQLTFIVTFLLIISILLGIVGGIGLMGTMGINVLERTREIGVLRAIGASDRAVLRLIITEGIFIGILSWLIGSVLSLPLGRFLSDSLGNVLTRAPLLYSLSLDGVLLWLFVVIALAAFASFLPARSAAKITVREALAFE